MSHSPINKENTTKALKHIHVNSIKACGNENQFDINLHRKTVLIAFTRRPTKAQTQFTSANYIEYL